MKKQFDIKEYLKEHKIVTGLHEAKRKASIKDIEASIYGIIDVAVQSGFDIDDSANLDDLEDEDWYEDSGYSDKQLRKIYDKVAKQYKKKH